MVADLPNWRAGLTVFIDVERATVHARGSLEIFTVELLRGAIANLALRHPPRITLSLTEVTDMDRYTAGLLDDWQRNGVDGSIIPIDIADPSRPASTRIWPCPPEPATVSDRPGNTSGVGTTSRPHGRSHGLGRDLTLAPTSGRRASQTAEPRAHPRR